MEKQDSIILKAIADEANGRILRGDTTKDALAATGEIYEIVDDAILKSPDLALDYVKRAMCRISKTVEARRLHGLKMRRKVSKRFGQHFRMFDEYLALAEITNRRQADSIAEWQREGFEEKFAPPFPYPELAGGAGVKCLLINSLNARSIVIAQEIAELLKCGFQEAARARARTLHEILAVVTILAVGSKKSTQYAVSNRYYISAMVEGGKAGASDNYSEQLVRRAKRLWGKEFLDQYGWARPVLNLRGRERPTFAHLERYIELHVNRHLYLEYNHSIHVGAMNTVNRADFRRRYPNSTRAENDIYGTRRILHATSGYLGLCMHVAMREVSTETESWDDCILLGMLMRLSGKLLAALNDNS